MKNTTSYCDNTPAYMRLYEQIKNSIISGVYAYGSRLPSKRNLADDMSVSVITVQHAYSILCDEGYIEAKERCGYFVVYRKNDFLPHSSTSTIITKLNIQNNTSVQKGSFPFSVIAKTMRKVLNEYGDVILQKSPNQGCIELRDAISAYLTRACGICVSSNQIFIGSGSEYLYSLIAQLFGNSKIFALENPSYDKIEKVYRANSIKCEMLQMAADGILTSELEKTNASVLHITPFNSYPSGITATASKRYEYLQWAKSRNGYIIEDNYDSELTISFKNDDTIFSIDDSQRVIYLNTFSNTIAPSVRVGYMVLPLSIAKEFTARLGFYSCTVPVFEQFVLAQLLNNGDFERHIHRIRRIKRKQLKSL